MKSQILKFNVLKEEISAENVLEMSEVIASEQTRFLIGYMGTRMQKMYAEVRMGSIPVDRTIYADYRIKTR